MTTLHPSILLPFFLWTAFFQCELMRASEALPENYDDVKTKLDLLTSPADLPSLESQLAKQHLLLHADEMNSALQILFKQDTRNKYRTPIMSLLVRTTDHKDQTINFVETQLNGLTNQESGQTWIVIGLEFLSANAPTKSTSIIRKWLSGSNPDLQLLGISAMEKIGTSSDLNFLEDFLYSSASGSSRDPYPERAAKEAILKMRQRLNQN